MRYTLSTYARLMLVSLLVSHACAEDTLPVQPMGERLDCSIVAIHSDYLSTSVSLLNGDGSLCADHVLHSGSSKPGLAAALSGDVVVPTGRHPDGLVTLIDRFPSGTMTWLHPESLEVVGQMSVATGFASNPQDVIYLSPTRAYVSRGAVNPTPTSRASDFDDGGDILIIDPSQGSIEGRVDLMGVTHSTADVTLHPYAGSMVHLDGTVWVALGHQSADFGQGGEGLVVGIDTRTDTIIHVLNVPTFKNCTTLRATADGTRLWGACAGIFQEGPAAQMEHSGLFTVDLTVSPPVVDWTKSASSFGERPLGFSLSIIDRERVLALVFGDFATDTPDRLVLVDRATEEVTYVGLESGAYELGGVLWNPDREVALVADASLSDPAVLVIDPWSEMTLINRLQANPTAGLPPRQLRFFR